MRYKHPRIFHLPGSHLTTDDRELEDLSYLSGVEVVATLKMDGENTTVYGDGYVHARSTTYSSHPTRNGVRALGAALTGSLTTSMRICLENLYGTHTIQYKDLRAYYQVHSVWIGETSLSWEEVVYWASELRLATVQEFYKGPLDLALIHSIFLRDHSQHEGYVVRTQSSIPLSDYSRLVGKWVRRDFKVSKGQWNSGLVNSTEYVNSFLERDLWSGRDNKQGGLFCS